MQIKRGLETRSLAQASDEALPLGFQKLQVGSHCLNIIIAQRDEIHPGDRGEGPLDRFWRSPQDFRRRSINSPGVDPVTGSASHAARGPLEDLLSPLDEGAGAGVTTSEEPHARKRECTASSPAMVKHLSGHIAVLLGYRMGRPEFKGSAPLAHGPFTIESVGAVWLGTCRIIRMKWFVEGSVRRSCQRPVSLLGEVQRHTENDERQGNVEHFEPSHVLYPAAEDMGLDVPDHRQAQSPPSHTRPPGESGEKGKRSEDDQDGYSQDITDEAVGVQEASFSFRVETRE